jgi:hypothetical protein
MKKSRTERPSTEAMLLRMKPVVDQFHSQKRERDTKYPLEVRDAVLEAWACGMGSSKISTLLGINLNTIYAWRRFLPIKNLSRHHRRRSIPVKGNLKKLEIVPDAIDMGSAEEMVQVHLPNKVILKIPSHRVGLDLLKGLMALEAVCS